MKRFLALLVTASLLLPAAKSAGEDKSTLNTTESEQKTVLAVAGGIITLGIIKLIIFGEKKERGPEEVLIKKTPKPKKVKKKRKEDLINIAVSYFSSFNVSSAGADMVSGYIRDELVRSGNFNVVGKKDMDLILKENGFHQSGCSSANCAVKLGIILKVKQVLSGRLAKLGSKYTITVNLVDVETAKVLKSEEASTDSQDKLQVVAQMMAQKIAMQNLTER